MFMPSCACSRVDTFTLTDGLSDTYSDSPSSDQPKFTHIDGTNFRRLSPFTPNHG